MSVRDARLAPDESLPPPRAPVYAHSRPGRPHSEWELLETHLHNVSELAAALADAFESSEWGRLAGLWHDVGKYRAAFQQRISGAAIQAPHAGAGAVLAFPLARPLAFAIAGHHAGLANNADQASSTQTTLEQVVAEHAAVLAEIRSIAPAAILDQARPSAPPWLRARNGRSKLLVDLWTRFLFSTLVDADRLATERFYDPSRRDALCYDTIPALRERLDAFADALASGSPIGNLRRDVLARCRTAAEWAPGLFSLTVPTGGGKTLSSMSFALRHAERHGLRRVIAVVPFTSIIEQNAAVYRDALGDANVLEHHSAVDEAAREREAPEAEVRRRLTAENWDAPIVVTTAVQFFETLFSNEPSRCRKLHSVARSVVVLDEAQTLPTGLLLTILDGLRQLADHYGCSIVLSTATQPALAARASLPQGLVGVREISESPAALVASLRRVAVRWPSADEATPLGTLAARMNDRRQVLTVVHRKRDACEIAKGLEPGGRYHLSTRMCAAHRLETLAEIRLALAAGRTCRVVSTQLVEAGVDLSFPVVFRAMAGLDSLAQAAGRCNRHGECRDSAGEPVLGEFVVFRAESPPPRGVLRKGLSVAEGMLAEHGRLDFTDPERLDEYFRKLYLASPLDEHGVMPEREAMNFATVAQRVRLIADGTHPVVVPWGEWRDRVEDFERSVAWSGGGARRAARALQPFVVQVFEHELRRLVEQGAVVPLEGFGHVVAVPFIERLYDPLFGLSFDEELDADPAALIV